MEIDISKLAETVMSDIEEIARAEMARVEDVIDTMADETCAQIKADSPAGGKYRSGWAIRKENKYGTRYRVVYNRKEPELTTSLRTVQRIAIQKAGNSVEKLSESRISVRLFCGSSNGTKRFRRMIVCQTNRAPVSTASTR